MTKRRLRIIPYKDRDPQNRLSRNSNNLINNFVNKTEQNLNQSCELLSQGSRFSNKELLRMFKENCSLHSLDGESSQDGSLSAYSRQ